MIKSPEKLADTTIQFSARVRANSPELQQLFDFIALGASDRDRDRILPYNVVEFIRHSRLGALRIPVAEAPTLIVIGATPVPYPHTTQIALRLVRSATTRSTVHHCRSEDSSNFVQIPDF